MAASGLWAELASLVSEQALYMDKLRSWLETGLAHSRSPPSDRAGGAARRDRTASTAGVAHTRGPAVPDARAATQAQGDTLQRRTKRRRISRPRAKPGLSISTGAGTRPRARSVVPTEALVQGSAAWHAARQHRLTASRFAAACGLSPYAMPRDLWAVYAGQAQRQAAGSAAVCHAVGMAVGATPALVVCVTLDVFRVCPVTRVGCCTAPRTAVRRRGEEAVRAVLLRDCRDGGAVHPPAAQVR